MFIQLREIWVSPTSVDGEPQFEPHVVVLHVNTDKVFTFNQVDFHDSHQYNDFKHKKTGETVEIPRHVVVDDVAFDKVTKVYMPISSDGGRLSDYIIVLETPEEIMEILGQPFKDAPKKKGRPPGSKTKETKETKETKNTKEK